jgi:NTP pyrophosphatase (non-canonical NTP hydrolase)
MTDINTLAKTIHDTAAEHGFWPTDRALALSALLALGNELYEPGEDCSEEFAKVRNYIEAQEVRNMGEMLMLATSELAEGLEEHRDGRPVVWYKTVIHPSPPSMDGWPEQAIEAYRKMRDNFDIKMMGGEEVQDYHEITEVDHEALVNVGILKPEGLAVELADCIIRCLDTMQSLGVDIEAVIEEKMAYNNSREFKHGKSY